MISVAGVCLSATQIRDWIASNGPWQDYVPESTRRVIERVGGVEIIKNLAGNYGKERGAISRVRAGLS